MEPGSNEVVEGFLCPMCLKDMKTPILLAAHFEDVHASENDLMQQLKSVFGKAKKKIFKEEHFDETDNELGLPEKIRSQGVPGTGGVDIELWEPQEFGASRNWMGEFKRARKLRIESYVVEINKSLIRLEKLVKSGIFTKESSVASGAKVRKNIERSVVLWENDADVKYCPHCTKKFSVTFRRHHCRLCGKVTCGGCSDFLLPLEAGSLLKIPPISPLLGTQKNEEEEIKNGLRICTKCKDLLDRCRIIEQQKQAGTDLVKLYNILKEFIGEADRLLPVFRTIADSVNAGETEYGIERALKKRKEVYFVLEKIDAVSKRILKLGTSNPEKPASIQSLRLQRSISRLVSSYLQDNMIALPALPSSENYAKLVQKREAERKRQEEALKRERLAVQEAEKAHLSRSNEDVRSSAKPRGKVGHLRENGTNSLGSSPDPMIQQMEIIRGYIKQAKSEKQYDNVELFENNLRELEKEYSRQKKLQR